MLFFLFSIEGIAGEKYDHSKAKEDAKGKENECDNTFGIYEKNANGETQ